MPKSEERDNSGREGAAAASHEVDRRLRGTTSLTLVPALTGIRENLTALVHPGFVTATGWARLPDLPRYLRALQVRLDKLPENPGREMRVSLFAQQLGTRFPVSDKRVRKAMAQL